MKVTHFLYFAEMPGIAPFSGVENHLWQLLPALVERGCDVELLAVLWLGEGFPTVRRKLGELREKGVRITVVHRDNGRRSWMGERASKLAARIVILGRLWERRDRIIHLHLEIGYTPFLAWIAGCRRIIYSFHSDAPMLQQLEWRRRLRVLNRIVTKYIAISERVRTYILDLSGCRPEQVTTVRYGIDLPAPVPMSRRELEIPENAYVVGFVGRLTLPKNLHVFLDAIKLRPDALGVIVGDGDQQDQLRRYAEKKRITNVRFIGRVPDAYRLMPLFDLFCLPSLWEGFGLVLLEAMLSSVPIIASARGAIPEVLGQGRYGTLFEPTVDGLVEAIDASMKSIESLRQRAESALEYCKKEYSVERMAQETIAAYQGTF